MREPHGAFVGNVLVVVGDHARRADLVDAETADGVEREHEQRDGEPARASLASSIESGMMPAILS